MSISLLIFLFFSSEGHLSVASTQRERDQKFYMVNTSHQQQQSKPKRSSSGSSNGSNEQKPPQLPPRDTSIYSHELPTVSTVIFIF